MTTPIADPTDPSIWFISSAAESGLGAQVGDATLRNVHPAGACAGRPCVIHNPSDHHMREWRLNWRDDRGLMERLCPHGIGHPDPDDVHYRMRTSERAYTVHGCDGCCHQREGS